MQVGGQCPPSLLHLHSISSCGGNTNKSSCPACQSQKGFLLVPANSPAELGPRGCCLTPQQPADHQLPEQGSKTSSCYPRRPEHQPGVSDPNHCCLLKWPSLSPSVYNGLLGSREHASQALVWPLASPIIPLNKANQNTTLSRRRVNSQPLEVSRTGPQAPPWREQGPRHRC